MTDLNRSLESNAAYLITFQLDKSGRFPWSGLNRKRCSSYVTLSSVVSGVMRTLKSDNPVVISPQRFMF